MSEVVLPTTAGSIVTFEDWEDTEKTTKCRFVVTLVPGEFDRKAQEFVGTVWMDAYGEDGGMYDVSEERILAGNPKVIFEAPEHTFILADSFDPQEETQYGAIMLVDHPDAGPDSLAVFTPGAIDSDGEIIEASWVNGYDAYFHPSDVNDYATALLVKGADF